MLRTFMMNLYASYKYNIYDELVCSPFLIGSDLDKDAVAELACRVFYSQHAVYSTLSISS